MIIRLLQKTVYPTLKALTRFIFLIFYEKTTILHAERLHFTGPTLLISNHPNTLMDPLNAAAYVPRKIFFLANASLFKSTFGNWFFNTFYCIPIERAKDASGKRVQNTESFARCDAFLAGGGCLYIAPQGGSDMVRRVGKLKTGTARIGLSAERQQNFDLGLKIVPIGINYSDPTAFRGRVLLHVGESLFFKDYQTIYLQDSFNAAKKITEDLADRLSELIIDTEDEPEDQLLRCLETIFQTDKNPTHEQSYHYAQNVLNKIKITRKNEPERFEELSRQATEYQKKLRRLHLSDQAIVQPRISGSTLLYLLLGFPFFLYGWINNFPAAYTPAFLAKKLGLYIGYTSTVKALAGLITVPVFYGLQTFVLAKIGIPTWGLIIYLISLPVLGLFAWNYLQRQTTWRTKVKAQQLQAKAPGRLQDLRDTRKQLRLYGLP